MKQKNNNKIGLGSGLSSLLGAELEKTGRKETMHKDEQPA